MCRLEDGQPAAARRRAVEHVREHHKAQADAGAPEIVFADCRREVQEKTCLRTGPGSGLPRCGRTPWRPMNVTSAFRDLTRRGGVKARFHDLRHSHATQLLRQGIPVKVVSERLEHSTAAITLDVYSHVLPGMQEEAARKIDAVLMEAMRQQSTGTD